jgi:small-conductance mechanosensitive channel
MFAEFDWGLALRHAIYILALWAGLWLLRWLIVKRFARLVDRIESMEASEQDVRILRWVVDISLLVVGAMVTLSILQLVPWLMIGTIGSRLLALVAVWLAVWFLVRYLGIWINALDDRIDGIDLDPRDVSTLERLLAIGIIVVAIVVTLAILGLTSLLYSALTAAGVFGIVIGFAVKDIAANFISGIFILIDRPFVIGDSIKIKDIAGTVANISLRSTDLVTFDGPVVTIPNSMMATEPTTNYTLSQYRRIVFIVSVLSTVDLNRATRIIEDTLEDEPRLMPDRPPAIYVDQIRDYVVDLQVVAYTNNQQFFDTQSDLKKAITGAFTAQGVDLAVPIRVQVTAVNEIVGEHDSLLDDAGGDDTALVNG